MFTNDVDHTTNASPDNHHYEVEINWPTAVAIVGAIVAVCQCIRDVVSATLISNKDIELKPKDKTFKINSTAVTSQP